MSTALQKFTKILLKHFKYTRKDAKTHEHQILQIVASKKKKKLTRRKKNEIAFLSCETAIALLRTVQLCVI